MDTTSILVKLARNSTLIELSTVSRLCGYKGRFLINVSTLKHWILDHEDGGISFYDSDCGNYLEMRKIRDKYLVNVTWLTLFNNGRVSGVRQSFEVSAGDLWHLVFDTCSYSKIVRLYRPQWRQSKIIMDSRCGVSDNKLVRRAFSKVMRDCFKWGDDERIYLYPDYGHGYGFTEYVGEKRFISGGLIAHFSNIQAPNGRTYTKVTYSVHT